MKLTHGDDQRELLISAQLNDPGKLHSVSGRYAWIGLDPAESPAKVDIHPEEYSEITILRNADAGTATVKVLWTAGASKYPMSLSVKDGGGAAVSADGFTDEEIEVTVQLG